MGFGGLVYMRCIWDLSDRKNWWRWRWESYFIQILEYAIPALLLSVGHENPAHLEPALNPQFSRKLERLLSDSLRCVGKANPHRHIWKSRLWGGVISKTVHGTFPGLKGRYLEVRSRRGPYTSCIPYFICIGGTYMWICCTPPNDLPPILKKFNHLQQTAT